MFKFVENWIQSYASKAFGAIARHLLTVLAGALAGPWAMNNLDITPQQITTFQDAATPIVAGLATFLFSLVWSLFQKSQVVVVK